MSFESEDKNITIKLTNYFFINQNIFTPIKYL